MVKKYVNDKGRVVEVDIDLLPLSHAAKLKEFTPVPVPEVIKERKTKKNE